jgi:sterol desaturase/sphingolipid hydroxylase (fatty acid hydroxylase superfamily)
MDKLCDCFSHKKVHYVHHRDRRKTPLYLKRREFVKDVWTFALIIVAFLAQIPAMMGIIVVILMVTTFFGFGFLEEEIEDLPIDK